MSAVILADQGYINEVRSAAILDDQGHIMGAMSGVILSDQGHISEVLSAASPVSQPRSGSEWAVASSLGSVSSIPRVDQSSHSPLLYSVSPAPE